MQAHRGRIPWATIACTCILGSVGLKLDLTEATPYNPHVANGMQPWFEGWYTRVTADSGLSFAAVTGSFPEQSLSYPAAFAGVLFQPHKGRTRTYQEFPPALHVTGPGGQPVHQQPDLLSDADFALHASDESFNLTIGGSDFSMSAATEGALLTVEGAGPLIRWGPTPGDTPEGDSWQAAGATA